MQMIVYLNDIYPINIAGLFFFPGFLNLFFFFFLFIYFFPRFPSFIHAQFCSQADYNSSFSQKAGAYQSLV